MNINFDQELNADQLRVVRAGDGPCLVLAGAGTGKTRTIVYRVAYLLEQGLPPERLLLVTFTNKAAKEMLGRAQLLVGQKMQGLWGGTFHHIGHILLRKYGSRVGLNPGFSILDQDDNIAFLKSVMEKMGRRAKDDEKFPSPGVLENMFSFASNSQRDLSEVMKDWMPKSAYLIPEIQKISVAYEQEKRARNAVSFDDLLLFWLRLLREYPDLRQKIGGRFDYILIDEYQDTSRLQGLIVEELAKESKNVLVVGDDAQSIYSFRAATVDNIMRFPEIFPGARIFRLERNYRSVQQILNLANFCLSRNKRQFQKELSAALGQGKKPEVYGFANEHDEASFIAERVVEFYDQGEPLQQSAVLFRAAYQAMYVELELQKRHIPYIIRGGIRFFEQAHIKDVLAYLRVAANHMDEVSWRRILKMEPGVGDRAAEIILEAWEHGNMVTLTEKIRRSADLVRERVEKLKSFQQADHMIEYLLDDFYRDYAETEFENAMERIEDLEQLAVFAQGYDSLEQFLADAALSEGFRGDRSSLADPEKDYLVLSTIHQAKGLEWKNVFVIGLCDGQFPHYKSMRSRQEIEEERRLFYVAVTRAKERLFLTCVHTKTSLFLRELDQDLFEYENQAYDLS